MKNPVVWPDTARQAAFERWLGAIAPQHGIDPATLAPASADASFRRYLRVQGRSGARFIIMDAPPPQEDVRPFVHVAALIQAAGLNAPPVLQADTEQGFLLLGDLGERVYLQALQAAPAAEADRLMRDALAALVQFQQRVPADALPPFDEALLARELALFPQWCVQREFGVHWSAAEQATWQRACRLLMDSALAQPVVAVHADWMPRNLMVTGPGSNSPGILDFQDAVAGPITYDLASLLRDAFISWEEPQEIDWAVRWWEQARRAGLPVQADFGEFWRALEWMGLQRHLKVLGIFCRLKHRDGKPHYATDLPRFFTYAHKVALRYAPLAPLARLLEPLSGPAVQTGHTL
ncbi:aminoglycoside phosphotransferase family protein [Brevundimonas sp.]|uniref:aminoglycoside phosphotransferase family protein n=1 Tax=Brevundimonas sp. TaxID=1871086 RepID=UPI0027307036|nr:phosphotransferase [Brevundimonas sp.]MDP1912258.1 phosphotransferase [Brevundimonas sp.]